jgi:hypothetical protein
VIDNYFCSHVDVNNIFGFNTYFVGKLCIDLCSAVDKNTMSSIVLCK